MHFEFLLEEPSTEKVLRNILSGLITGTHTYRCIVFQGKQDLLKKLPSQLRAYKRWIPADYKIVVVIDRDDEDCRALKRKLNTFVTEAGLVYKSGTSERFDVLNRIIVEELESWFFGDPDALKMAYPKLGSFEVKAAFKKPDEIRNTWEKLERLLQQKGYFKTGLRKIELASEVSRYMQPLKNRSKSFQVFWSGIVECISA